jgi:hypothetical protein
VSIDISLTDVPQIEESTLILVINRAYVNGSSMADVYGATRGHWRVGPATRNAATLVLGVADGVVRGVFRPTSWFPSPIDGQEGRWGFEGAEAQELSHIIGSSIDRLPVPKGASNPVRLYLNGIPEAGAEGPALQAAWDVEPGDYLGRQERQDLYGGATYGGIQPSVVSPNVFLYSDPAQGGNYGYQFDGWNEKGTVFYYTGEGRTGDQRMRVGNQSILGHAEAGRALRLFIADGFEAGSRTARQQYVGQFDVDPERPFETETAPDQDGAARLVYVFRLLPVGPTLVSEKDLSVLPISDVAIVAEVALDDEGLKAFIREIDIETMSSAESAHEVLARTIVIRRLEATLVLDLQSALEARGHQVFRQQIKPAGQANPIYTDLFDSTDKILFEAKSDSSRESIRMAIGQLLDYRRFLPPETRLAVLVPTKPARDLLDLLDSVEIKAVYPDAHGDFFTLSKVSS